MTTANPFAQRSVLDYELPPFALITEEHYLPAFYEGCTAQLAEVQAILDTPGAATFENTIAALEISGQYLMRMLLVFYNKSSSDTNDALDAIEEEMAPKLAAHQDAINLNPVLFKRIKDLYDARESIGLNSEDSWLLERYYKDLIHAGAHLTEAQRDRLKELNEELSKLETQFSKNILADTNDLAVLVESVEELNGLSENEIAAASTAACDRGHEGKWLIGMVNFTGNPVLDSLTNRELRKKIMEASLLKANRTNENDNKPVLLQLVKLRAERARLFGKELMPSTLLQYRPRSIQTTFMQCFARSHQLQCVMPWLKQMILKNRQEQILRAGTGVSIPRRYALKSTTSIQQRCALTLS